MNESNWRIEHQCPQCGAPVVLDEADNVLLCPFCKTRLYLTAPDHFRLHIPAQASVSRHLIYIPYWRLKGNSFSVDFARIEPRFVDTNILAAQNFKLPYSLGLRPQAMTIKFTSPDLPGCFLKVDREPSAVIDDAESTAKALMPVKPHFFKAFIGETVSLVYSPAYEDKGMLYDAFTKKRLAAWDSGEMEPAACDVTPPNWRIKFLSTLCPHCGWDMEGEGNVCVMICRNCDTAWHCRHESFEQIEFSVLPAETREPVVYLPFWRMKPASRDIPLSCFADLIRLVNLPRAIQKQDEAKPVYFWSPAFKSNPSLFLKLCRQMTAMQPDIDNHPVFGAGKKMSAATLPVQEAVQSMKITLAQMASHKRLLYPQLSKLELPAQEAMLVYHPFKIDRLEFVHASAPIAIDRQALNPALHVSNNDI